MRGRRGSSNAQRARVCDACGGVKHNSRSVCLCTSAVPPSILDLHSCRRSRHQPHGRRHGHPLRLRFQSAVRPASAGSMSSNWTESEDTTQIEEKSAHCESGAKPMLTPSSAVRLFACPAAKPVNVYRFVTESQSSKPSLASCCLCMLATIAHPQSAAGSPVFSLRHRGGASDQSRREEAVPGSHGEPLVARRKRRRGRRQWHGRHLRAGGACQAHQRRDAIDAHLRSVAHIQSGNWGRRDDR